MHNLVDAFTRSAGPVAEHAYDAASMSTWSDEEFLAVQRTVATHRHSVDAITASLAGEASRRSARELGYTGLAQKTGLRTPEELVRAVTGLTRTEAARFVAVGTLMGEAERAEAAISETPESGAPELSGISAAPPWHAPIIDAVTAGILTVDGADAIRRGLGASNDTVAEEQLRTASTELLKHMPEVSGLITGAVPNPDHLYRDARAIRDRLDAAEVADREEQQRNKRSLRRWTDADGMRHVNLLMDPGSAQILDTAIDALLSPRRGGPRFVNPDDAARAEAILNDPRTTEQLAHDALVDLIRIAEDVDPNAVFGTRRPEVKIIVSAEALGTRTGVGYRESTHESVPLTVVDQHLCNTGATPIALDESGQPLDVGRDQRLFTGRQREALAVRDGGCLWPQCDRPPSWTEAHHIHPWSENGRTDVADGVLLCRHHHMLLHNNGWRIEHADPGEDSLYRLIPPPSRSFVQRPIPLPTKAPWRARPPLAVA